MRGKYPIKPWRTIYDIAVCWGVIAACIAMVYFVNWWLYPIAVIIIANRILALGLLAHEGIHGNLHPNLKVNDFIGRYFCAFPVSISFSKYRRLHLLHHSAVGSQKWDPDHHLYASFPHCLGSYLRRELIRFFFLKTYRDFLSYYNELPDLWNRKRAPNGKLFVFTPGSDLVRFVVFRLMVIGCAYFAGVLPELIFLIIIPGILSQPYIYFMGALQHGPIPTAEGSGFSRTVRGSKLYMWLLLPVDICFHAEHHRNAAVPHYWLKDYAADLEQDGVVLWKGSYRQALRDLFVA